MPEQDLLYPVGRMPLFAAQARETPRPCTWIENEDGVYETNCGNMFVFNDGTPSENGFAFCPYCGLELSENENSNA